MAACDSEHGSLAVYEAKTFPAFVVVYIFLYPCIYLS